MGGDGQAFADKRTLLEKSKFYSTTEELEDGEVKAERQSDRERRAEKWSYCALSLGSIEFPVVFDLAGSTFSKQSVLDYLIALKKGGSTEKWEGVCGISKLSDVREIPSDCEKDGEVVCPVTGSVAAYGVHMFVGFWGCGHVVTLSSLSTEGDVPDEGECPHCGEVSVIVRIHPSAEEGIAQQKKLRPILRAGNKRKRSS